MKFKTILGVVLMLPLVLIVIGSFGVSIYAAYNNISGITWASPIIIGSCIILYIIGRYISRDKKNETQTDNN